MKYIRLEELALFAQEIAGKITELFVRKEAGKGLSANDYTDEEKEKLAGLENLTVDSAMSDTSENPVQNRAVNEALGGRVPVARKINNKDLSEDITLSAADVGGIAVAEKGASGGVAELDSNGRVPAAQLPSFVDDVLEGYYHDGVFFDDDAHTVAVTGESGKIYIDIGSGKTYRWSGTAYAVISDTIALGETVSTAYRGDHGKTAYDHSQTAHAPANAQANVQADWDETDVDSDAYIRHKPSAIPPSAHTHNVADIADLQEATQDDIDNIIEGLFL